MSLDPDCVKIHELYALAKRPPIETVTPTEARLAYRQGAAVLGAEPPEVGEVRDLETDGPAGTIPLRLYRPKGAAAGAMLPGVIFFHGGGWTIGDLETHDSACRLLCNESGAAVVAVDYRLAPEHRFPAAVEDAYAATCWIAAYAQSMGIDAARLAVAGDSAGGNLAAVVALMARDVKPSKTNPPDLKLQVLIYPAIDFTMSSASFVSRGDVLPLTAPAVAWFRGHYLGPDADRLSLDWRASPIVADLKGLPPAYIVTAGYDVLCDEGRAYADKLEAAGVPVERAHFPGQIHGFITMGKFIQAAHTAVSGCAAAIKRAL